MKTKSYIMRAVMLAAVVTADPYEKLSKLSNAYKMGALSQTDYDELRTLIVGQIKKAEGGESKAPGRRILSEKSKGGKCLADMIKTSEGSAECLKSSLESQHPSVKAILAWLPTPSGGGGKATPSFRCSKRRMRRSMMHMEEVDQDKIIRDYFGHRQLSDIEDETPGLPDDVANYRDDSGCMILVGSGDTSKKSTYQVGGDLTNYTFDKCASACTRNEECVAVSWNPKAKRCELFKSRWYELSDANHVIASKDGSLWYDNVCLMNDADPCEMLDNLNALQVAFHSYHLARRVNGYGSSACSDAKAIDSAAGFTFYQVKPNDNNVMTTANVIKRCKACGLRPACYTYRAGHTYNHPDCKKVDKYFDAVGYPSGGKNGHKELQRILAKRLCGSDNVSACGNKGKLTSCAAIRNWSGGSACCSKGGWCNPGNNDRPSSGYLDLCVYIPGEMSGYSNSRN